MRLSMLMRTYLMNFSKRALALLLLGLLPLYAALGFLLYLRTGGSVGVYDALWLRTYFAFWVDSVGISLLLLVSGAMLLDYAERHDGEKK